MNASRTPTRAQIAIAGLLVATLAGCTGFPGRKVPLDAKSGFYADATLTYRLDAGKLGQPLDVVRVDGQRVWYEQVASSPLPDESIGTLSIHYPHPAGRQGVALARFTLDSTKHQARPAPAGWNPFVKNDGPLKAPMSIASVQPEIHETWELDIATAEFNQVVKLLNDIGFYHERRPGAAHLSVKMDGVEQSKEWDQVPALNMLVRRVRTSGRLVAYACPATTGGSPTSTIASTAVYHDLLAQRTAAGAAAADQATVASAFSLSPPMAFSAPPVPGVAPAQPGYPPVGAIAARPSAAPPPGQPVPPNNTPYAANAGPGNRYASQPYPVPPAGTIPDPNNPYAAVLAQRPSGTLR